MGFTGEHPDRITVAQTPDVQPAGAEKQRLSACLAPFDDRRRARVGQLLASRLRTRPDAPGFDRFIAVGASASRNMYFLTGFGRKTYSLAPDWAFLEPTIRWFSGTGRRRPFLYKGATVSGTSAGAWVYGGRICDGCEKRLRGEVAYLNAAYAVLMFGTNNVSMNPMPGYRKRFLTRIAAGPLDAGCRGRDCLPAWDPVLGYRERGRRDLRAGPGRALRSETSRALDAWVSSRIERKRKRFGDRYRKLVRRLTSMNVVPVLTTIPPMPRRWLDEDIVAALNAEVKAIADEQALPLIDLWCALTPLTADGRLDWAHPVVTGGKGIGVDRYHPRATHAFDVSDANLVHGYNARNTMTLLTLHRLKELVAQLRLDTPEPILAETERPL